MAVYSMIAFERAFFSQTCRINKVMNFSKVDFSQIEKIIRYLNSASKSYIFKFSIQKF